LLSAIWMIRTCSRFEPNAVRHRSRLRRRPEGRAKRVILHDPPMQKSALKALFCYLRICSLSTFLPSTSQSTSSPPASPVSRYTRHTNLPEYALLAGETPRPATAFARNCRQRA